MNLDFLPFLAGAFSGTVCALLVTAIDAQAAKQRRQRAARRAADRLACRVAPALYAYASACLSVAYDTGGCVGLTPEDPDAVAFTAPRPVFVAAHFAVAWKSLPCRLRMEVLTFELQAAELEAPPGARDVSTLLRQRQSTHLRLGLKALRLAERLRRYARLRPLPQNEALREQLSLRLAELEAPSGRKQHERGVLPPSHWRK